MSEPMSQYVTIAPVVVEGEPDAHAVFLQVTNQRFCLGPYETREDAEWTRDMLCVALAKIVAEAFNELAWFSPERNEKL